MSQPSAPPANTTRQWSETLGRQLENLRPGAHLCAIYDRHEQQLHALVSFFRGALVDGRQCLYFADRERAGELARALRELDEDAAAALDRGALIPVTTRAPYVGRDGRFDPQAMLELHAGFAQRARAAGFAELRIAGEMAWVLGEEVGRERFLAFEARLNETLRATGSSGLCQYERRRTEPSVIRDVLRTHPLAIIDLQVHRNMYYEPIDLVLANRGESEHARVDWMITQLQSATRREAALVDLGRIALEGASADLMSAAQALVATELGLDYVQIFEPAPGALERLDPDNILASAELRAGQPLIVSDWHAEPRFKLPAALQAAGVTSSVAILMSTGQTDRVWGMLVGHSRAARIFSDDEILFLETVGTFLAYAIAAAHSASSFRALVENAPDVIARFDGDLHITYVNPAIERVTGTAAEVLVGKSSLDLGILKSQVPAWELVLRQVWRTGREQSFELTVGAPLGERLFDTRIIPELGSAGEVQSLLSIARDVTAARRVETERHVEAERSALQRELVVQQDHVHELMERLAQNRERNAERAAAAAPLEYLTERERAILRLLAAGRTNSEIGAQIGLARGTVKNLVAQILAKLNASDRTQAAVRAVELGVVETPQG